MQTTKNSKCGVFSLSANFKEIALSYLLPNKVQKKYCIMNQGYTHVQYPFSCFPKNTRQKIQTFSEYPEAVFQRCSVKKVFLKISKIFFIKKETLAQVVSCEFCEIFKNPFFHRTRLVAASEYPRQFEIYLKPTWPKIFI